MKLSVAHPLARKARTDVRLFFGRRDGIAAMTSGARQAHSVFAIIELVQSTSDRWPIEMHRLDVAVAFQAAFERRRGRVLRTRRGDGNCHRDTEAKRTS